MISTIPYVLCVEQIYKYIVFAFVDLVSFARLQISNYHLEHASSLLLSLDILMAHPLLVIEVGAYFEPIGRRCDYRFEFDEIKD